MPIYEYSCKDCETVFEEIVLKSDEIPQCPQCKGTKTIKLISKSRHLSSDGNASGDFQSPQPSSSSCGSCSGGSCSTCR